MDITYKVVDADGDADTLTFNVDIKAAAPAVSASEGDGKVTLSWTDPDDDGITKYQVKQWTGASEPDPGTWTDIASSDADTTSHEVTGLTNGTEYSFRVRAVTDGLEGVQSNVVSATPAEAVTGPAFVSATARLKGASGTSEATITLTFAGALDESSVPAASAFAIDSDDDGGQHTPSTVAVSGSTVTLTMPAGLESGEKVAITYTAPSSNPLQDADGNDVVDFTSGLVAVAAAPSDDADLSGLTISAGTLSPGFTAANLTYTASVGNSVTSVTVTPTASDATNATIKVNGTVVASGSASGAITLTVGPNTITIEVEAEDTSTKTYTVTVTRLPLPTLSIAGATANEGAGTISFVVTRTGDTSAASTVDYATSVAQGQTATSGTDFTAVTAGELTFPADSTATQSATVTITNDSLDEHNEKFTVTLSNASGATIATASAVGTITDDDPTPTAELRLSKGSIDENGGETAVTAVLTGGTSSVVTRLTVSATEVSPAEASDFTLSEDKVLTIAAGATTSTGTVTITAEDNSVDAPNKSVTVSAVATNTVGITGPANVTLTINDDDETPESSDNDLSGLTISQGTLTPTFGPAIIGYTASVGNSVSSMTVTPTASDATNAIIKVGETVVASGSASGTIDLDVGPNTITIDVEAEDGTTKTYTITVTRAASSDNDLSGLTISQGTLTPTFASATTAYTASVGNDVESVTVTPTANHAEATITVNGTEVTSGSASGAIDLDVGDNTITIVVTAENESTKTYTVTVRRNPSVTGGGTDTTIERTDDGGDLITTTVTSDSADIEVQLTLPSGHSVTGVTFSAPSTSVDPPEGVSFGTTKVWADIEFAGTLPENEVVIICLPEPADATGTLNLYHLGDGASAWTALDKPATSPEGYVCGETATLSPVAVGQSDSTLALDAIDDQPWTVDTQIIDLTLPEASGGDGSYIYALTPDIAIYDLELTGRVISGRPDRPTTSSGRVFTWTATDGEGAEVSQTFTVTITAPASKVVSIPDAELRREIEDDLNKSSADAITAGEMATLTSARWRNDGIVGLTGLEFAINVTGLNLDENSIVDLSPLANLTSLTSLDLDDNDITDVSALAGLTSLTGLGLDGNSIVDLSPLAGLTSLIILNLEDNGIVDLSTLAGLPSLRTLDLDDNDITDVSALADLTSLNSLLLDGNSITDISPLASLTLSSLELIGNPLSYPSINTHIPAHQATGAMVQFDDRTPTGLAVFSGGGQSGTVGTALGKPLVVEVADQNNVVFEGVPVTFAVTAGGGSVAPTTPSTDSAGRAQTTLTLGSTAGTNTVSATAAEITAPVVFTTTGAAVGALALASIPDQPWAVDTAITDLTLPAATGGDGSYTYALTPAITIYGLDLSGSVISGTPDRPTPRIGRVFTWTVTDGAGAEASQTFTVTITAPASKVVSIPDAKLLAEIEDDLSKSSGDTITAGDMATLTTADWDNENIVNLTGLEFAINLTELRMAQNRIVDVSPLAGLTSLTRLFLDDNSIVDVSPLAGQTSLTLLSLDGNSIVDLSPLTGLTSLTVLDLESNSIVDVSPLASLNSLTSLDLAENSIVDVTPLAGLTSLNLLYLNDNAITDVSPLAGLTGLTTLHLGGNLLDYPSINTHVAALVAEGVTVSFDDRTPTTIVVSSGNSQSGPEGTDVANPLVVEVKDQNAAVFAGVPVTFAVTAGGGSVAPADTATDSAGLAQTTLTLGSTPGTNTVRATAAEITAPVVFTATGLPTVSIQATAEADEGTGTISFTVTPTGSTSAGFEVSYATSVESGQTATSGTDFTAASGKLTWAANDSEAKTISVTIADDSLDENDEKFTVTLSGATGGVTIVTAVGVGTITDNDPTPTVVLALSENSIDEDGGETTVTASLTGGTSGAATTLTVSASPSGDVTLSQNTTIIIDAGATTSTDSVTITTVNNSVDAADNTVTVSAVATNDVGITQPTSLPLTITDDDDPPVVSIEITAAEAAVNEGDSDLTADATVKLDAESGKTVTVDWKTVDGGAKAGSDYTAVGPTKLTFMPGETSKTVAVTVLNDTEYEPDTESFTIEIEDPANATLHSSKTSVTVVITSEDAAPLSSDNTLSGLSTSAGPISFDSETTGYSVDVGNDVTSVTVTPTANDDGATIAVTATDADNATLTVTESSGVYTVTGLKAGDNDIDIAVTPEDNSDAKTYTITVTRALPTVSIDATSDANEDAGTISFTVTPTATDSAGFSVAYATSVESGQTATSGTDFTAASGTLTWAADGSEDSTAKTISVAILTDTLDEHNETFTVTLSNATGVTIVTAVGVGTITDNDPTPTAALDLSPNRIGEDRGSTTVTASLTGGTSGAVTTLTVSASPSGDVTLGQNTTITIAAGETTSTDTVTITAVNNNVDAADKTVTVSATATNDVGITQPTSLPLTIEDDDEPAPTPNNEPVITSNDGGETADIDYAEDRTNAVTTVAATDADNDSIEYTPNPPPKRKKRPRWRPL